MSEQSTITMPFRRKLRIYVLEAKYELFKMLRLPAFLVPTIAFPMVFYIFFGVSFADGSAGTVSMATYLLATYGVFGVIGAALFSFGVGVAIERGQGWTQVKMASPMPPLAYFVAKIAMAVIVSITIVAGLYILAIFAAGVTMPFGRWLSLAMTLVAGALPFCALGLALGCLAGPNSAPAIVNLVYLPMSFISGLWIPIEALPQLVQTIAPAMPAYHYAELALATIGARSGAESETHLVVLAAFTIVSLAVASWAWKRDEGRTFG